MRKIALLFCLLLALTGCQRAGESAPIWTAELADGGTAVLSGCTLLSEETAVYTPKGETEGQMLPMLRVEGVPTLTVTGVEPEQVDVQFACWAGENAYTDERNQTLPKVDYRLTERADGTLDVLLDNVYDYRIQIGEQNWILICYREGLREP